MRRDHGAELIEIGDRIALDAAWFTGDQDAAVTRHRGGLALGRFIENHERIDGIGFAQDDLRAPGKSIAAGRLAQPEPARMTRNQSDLQVEMPSAHLIAARSVRTVIPHTTAGTHNDSQS